VIFSVLLGRWHIASVREGIRYSQEGD
jgi:hypothetical protein